MPLISRLGAASSRGFGEFNQQAQGKYIEDYFSTYLYTGNGASQTIDNGIALSDTASWTSYVLQGSGNGTSGQGITVDSSGNFYLSGSDLGTDYSGTRYAALTAKYNSSGVLQWQRIAYSSTGNNTGAGVAVDTSGNVYSLFSNTASGYAFNLRKYDSSGSLQWQRNLGGGASISSVATSVAVDSSSNVYVVGRSPQYVGDSDNIIVAKYNSSGTIQWQKSIKQSTVGQAEAVAVDSSDNIYVAGTAYDGSYTYAILIKMDTSGAITWQRSLRHSSNGASGYSVAVDSSGNAYIGGTATDNSGSYSFVAKYNSSGTLQWQRYFSLASASSQIVRGIYVNSSGDVHIAARLYNSATGTNVAYVAKYNSSGTLQWQRAFPGVSSLNNNCLSGDSSGNIYLNLGNIGGTSQAIVKLKSDGTTASGSAFVTMVTGSATSASGSLTSSTSTATNNAGSLTTATGAITDYAGGLTNTSYTQAAVTGAGGLVWLKSRSNATNHALLDTDRGTSVYLSSNTTNANTTNVNTISSFDASGFSLGSSTLTNSNAATYASWTFRKAPKFFDVVTYTGNGTAGRTISHSLGVAPGMIIVKKTNTTQDWLVYHRSVGNTSALFLNLTDAQAAASAAYWNNTSPTATEFTVGNNTRVNLNGDTYVAYLFAHDAGGFGADGSQNVISCGSFTNASGAVTLGYEPQFILYKLTSTADSWNIIDTMRGMDVSANTKNLYPNTSGAEASGFGPYPTATGFQVAGVPTGTYIYMAIRRGPMKTPTSGTSVFNPQIYTGDYNTTTPLTGMNPATDMWWNGARAINTTFYDMDRLRGWRYLETGNTAAEISSPTWSQTTQTSLTPSAAWWGSSQSQVNYFFNRAPGFFDIVCYTGTGSARTVSHNLGVTPELMIVKSRSDGVRNWSVYSASLGTSFYLNLNDTTAQNSTTAIYWNNTAPTASVFSLGTGLAVNTSGATYVAYLFASCPGVSKVGSYTGTGATQTINCGFTGGARFVLIKRTDSTGDWYAWDSARGMVAGTDPYKLVNTNNTETNTNSVYTTTGGFQIVSTAAGINASGGTYLFFAVS